MSRVTFFAPGLTVKRGRLQPWQYLLHMAQGAVESGHEVMIIGDEDFHYSLDNSGISLTIRKRRGQSSLIGRVWRFVDSIQETRPDLIVMGFGPSSVFLLPSMRRINAPFVGVLTATPPSIRDLMMSGSSWIGADFLRLYPAILDAVVPRCIVGKFVRNRVFRRFVVMSSASRNWLKSMGVRSDKILQISPGINITEGMAELRAKRINRKRSPEDLVVFCYMGPPSFIRGVDTLLKSFSTLSRSDAGSRLMVLLRESEDTERLRPYEDSLRRMTVKYGIENSTTFIKELQSRSQLLEAVCGADAAVFPFKLMQAEAPLSVIEASYLGVTVIVTDVDGLPELVNGRDAIVVNRGEAQLTDGLMKVVAEKRRGYARPEDSTHEQPFDTWPEARMRLVRVIESLHEGE